MEAISYCKDISITDFEFDWRISQNSGVYFHIPDLTQFPDRNHKEVRLYENRLWEKPDHGDHAARGITPGDPPTKMFHMIQINRIICTFEACLIRLPYL